MVLHKDAITLYDDLHGLNAVRGYFQVRLLQGVHVLARDVPAYKLARIFDATSLICDVEGLGVL